MDFFGPGTWPFTAALVIMAGIGAVELLGLMLGASVSGWVDDWGGVDHLGVEGSLLGWLHLGRVPALILLVLFLCAFGLAGLALQWGLAGVAGSQLPLLLALPLAGALALAAVRVLGAVLARFMPRDETFAVTLDALVGRVAALSAPAASGRAAQGRVRDAHGRSHYVMVEPEPPYTELAAGSDVLLVRRAGARFLAIPNPHADLINS